MRSIRFWILMVGSLLACALDLSQINFTRAIYQQQRTLAEKQQLASMATSYENSWKQLATRIYQASRQDPALIDILKREQIAVEINRPAASSPSTPQSTTKEPAASKSSGPMSFSPRTPVNP